VNIKTRNSAISDASGKFRILANVGDRIVFSGFQHQTDTLYLANLKPVEVAMTVQQNMLSEVKVVNSEIKTGNLKAPQTPYLLGSHALTYQDDEAIGYTGGININLFDSKKNEKKRKRDAQIEADEEKGLQLNTLFQPKNLEKYVPLKGTEMENFIILYTPTLEAYTASNFDLAAYLSDCYKNFLTYPADQRQSKTYFQLQKKSD
jgi:hypothetical protein